MGFVSRRDYSLNFSEDAAELIGAIANGETLQPGREYDLDLEAYGFDAEGVRVFLRPDIKSWLGLEFGLSFLRADYLIAGSASGTAQALSVDEYEYSLSVDYNYAEDILFEREVSGVTGLGASLDVSVEVQIDSWEFNLQIRDLLGALYWQDVPNTVADAYSDRVEINEAGYAEWSPAVSGVESNKDFTLWLQPRLNSSLIYNYGRARFGLGTHYWVEDWLPRIGFGYEFTHLDAYSWYWLESSLVEVSLIWPKIAVNAGLDSLTHDEVKALYIGASLNY